MSVRNVSYRASTKGEQGRDDVLKNIHSVVEAAKGPGHAPQKAVIAPANSQLIQAAKEYGMDLTGFNHVIDGSAVRHITSRHGNGAVEASRGQVAITDADFDRIPEVVNAPDRIILGTQSKRKRPQIAYIKRLADGTTLYMEEVRNGRHELATLSMRKYPAARDFDTIAGTLPSNARSDGGNDLSILRYRS